MSNELTPKQERFVLNYLKTGPTFGNATQSAVAAGYSPDTAKEQGYRLLTNVHIQQRIQKTQERRLERADVTEDRVLRELARIGFYDPRRMFSEDGRPLGIHELDDDTAAVIAGMDVFEEYEGYGDERVKTGDVRKWKIANKLGALDTLAKHLGLLIDRTDITSAGEKIRTIVTIELPHNPRNDPPPNA